MIIKRIQPHLKQLCKQLGPEYSIVLWDLEYVISRNFDNGFSVEMSGLNSASTKNPAQIYLWDLRDDGFKRYGYRKDGYIVANFIIPQDDLAAGVEWIHAISEALLDPAPSKLLPMMIRDAKDGWNVSLMPCLKLENSGYTLA